MKLKFLLILSFINFFMLSCERDTSALKENQYTSASLLNSQNVLLTLDSLKTRYTLDEEVKGIFMIQNVSDSDSIHIVSNHGPLDKLEIIDTYNDLVFYQPNWITTTYYDFYFKPRDKFKYQFTWDQIGYTYNYSIYLKVFSGIYFIHPRHIGINTTDFGLWIEITEKGEPLSSFLYYHYNRDDSLIVDYHIRNRISKEIFLNFKQTNPIEVNFIDYKTKEIVLSHYPNISFQEIQLNPKSDQLVYSYQLSRNDDLIRELFWEHYLEINLNFESMVISTETIILL